MEGLTDVAAVGEGYHHQDPEHWDDGAVELAHDALLHEWICWLCHCLVSGDVVETVLDGDLVGPRDVGGTRAAAGGGSGSGGGGEGAQGPVWHVIVGHGWPVMVLLMKS